MPKDRLFAEITDSNKLFDLRYTMLKSKAVYDTSAVKEFMGGHDPLTDFLLRTW